MSRCVSIRCVYTAILARVYGDVMMTMTFRFFFIAPSRSCAQARGRERGRLDSIWFRCRKSARFFCSLRWPCRRTIFVFFLFSFGTHSLTLTHNKNYIKHKMYTEMWEYWKPCTANMYVYLYDKRFLSLRNYFSISFSTWKHKRVGSCGKRWFQWI